MAQWDQIKKVPCWCAIAQWDQIKKVPFVKKLDFFIAQWDQIKKVPFVKIYIFSLHSGTKFIRTVLLVCNCTVGPN